MICLLKCRNDILLIKFAHFLRKGESTKSPNVLQIVKNILIKKSN